MTNWIDFFYASMFGVALLLSLMGVGFTAIIPGLDRWNKRFFLCYFSVFMLCCLSSLLEMIPSFFPISNAAFYVILAVESLFLSLPLPMLTVYLVHCRKETPRKSKLLWAVVILWAVYCAIVVSAPFVGGFTYVTPDNQYQRAPLYPIALAPLLLILLLNFIGVMRSRKLLSRKVSLAFLVAILPMTAAVILQMFADVFPLLDIGYVLSALSMYGLVLSDQIEQDRRRQQEIIHQRTSIRALQMRPHFIHNTLMSIYYLCQQDPEKAQAVTLDFASYLGKSFNAIAENELIPFTEELEHTRAYLAVEKARFEEQLFVEFDTPHTFFRLPPLTLQPVVEKARFEGQLFVEFDTPHTFFRLPPLTLRPVVENAVKHGISPQLGPLYLSVRTCAMENCSEITVEDTGPGFSPADDNEPHVALANIRERLMLMCGGTLDIATRPTGGTRVTIRIPMKRPPAFNVESKT